MSKKQLIIWFDNNGDMLSQAGTAANMARYGNHKSEEAKDFDANMEYISIQSYYRKESRAIFKEVSTGRKYSMFLDDFDRAIKAKRFIDNRIEGTFQFLKKGTGQAIKLDLPKDKP